MPSYSVYSKKVENLMHLHYKGLPEKQRRHYAAIKSLKLGYGGISYISRVLTIKRNTISQGIKELSNVGANIVAISYERQRKVDGGRKKTLK